MAFQHDHITASHQLVVGSGFPLPVLGVGGAKVRGSAFIQGPAVFGSATSFPGVWATVMIGPNSNVDSAPPFIPGSLCSGVNNPYSLGVRGPSAFMGVVDIATKLNVGTHIVAQGEVISRCGKHILSLKKNFDIQHPTKKGWRLRHTCPEGPSNDVYLRGKIENKTTIELPDYWRNLVNEDSITINLTPIGKNQNIFVEKIENNKVFLNSHNQESIYCYYHIFAERKDGEQLIPEYKGLSPEDYPGNNKEYSIVGYHYDIKK